MITTVTPTGSERVRRVYGDRVFNVYLPYDLPASIRRFLDRVHPRVAVVMETEIWPNLFFECQAHDIPVIIANGAAVGKEPARLWPDAPAGAQRAGQRALHRRAVDDRCGATARSRRRSATASASSATSSTTWPCRRNCIDEAAELRAGWGAQRPVWIAASTHDGEEMPVLKAHAEVLRRFPDALLLLAPRHPERFKPVVLACRSLGFATRTRSEDGSATQDTQCFVVDTLGELLRFLCRRRCRLRRRQPGADRRPQRARTGGVVGAGHRRPEDVQLRRDHREPDRRRRRVADRRRRRTRRRRHAPARRSVVARRRSAAPARAAFEREQGGVLRTLGIIERVLDGDGRGGADRAVNQPERGKPSKVACSADEPDAEYTSAIAQAILRRLAASA